MRKKKPLQRLKFKVFDSKGTDITDKEVWLINSEGYLFRETSDVDMPVLVVDKSEGLSVMFTYPDGDIIPFIN